VSDELFEYVKNQTKDFYTSLPFFFLMKCLGFNVIMSKCLPKTTFFRMWSTLRASKNRAPFQTTTFKSWWCIDFLIIIFVLVSFVLLLFEKDIFQSPENEDNSNRDFQSCVSFKSNGVNPSSENDTVVVGDLGSEAPSDCSIYSLALVNSRLNPKQTIQHWYNLLRSCSIANGLYDPALGGFTREIEDKCKAPISEFFFNTPETFTRVYATADDPNPINCPPFKVGDYINIIIYAPIPMTGSHAVSCIIRVCGLASTLFCHDRSFLGGKDKDYDYVLNIGINGQISSPDPNINSQIGGWSVTSASRPNI